MYSHYNSVTSFSKRLLPYYSCEYVRNRISGQRYEETDYLYRHLEQVGTVVMAKPKPVSVQTVFNMSGVTYVEGYDDPGANVVIVCSNQKAFRIHDYFLKAERSVRPGKPFGSEKVREGAHY